MKILVTGNAGSGKSTLGKQLSKKYNIPLYPLDKVVWKEGWQPTPKEEKIRLIEGITSRENWIIEGVSSLALEKAELVYFLNLPHHRCIFNIIKRFFKNGIGTRGELPKNCPEYIGVIKAIKISFLYEKLTKLWILEGIKNKEHIIVSDPLSTSFY